MSKQVLQTRAAMSEPEPRWHRWAALVLIFGLVIGGGYFVFRPDSASTSTPTPAPAEPRPADDPRLAYSGPYQNIHPSVRYVGDAVCAGCHDDKAETYRQHPMGRSLFPIAEAPQPPADSAHHNPFAALKTNLRVERADGRTLHHDFGTDAAGRPLYDFSMEVKYAIGSGTHGQSFLWEQDGYVQQTPITWYGQKKIWDASPGWLEVGGGRPVDAKCLFCHANRVDPLPGYSNRFAAPLFRGETIGCERCHGPGQKHVARWGEKGPIEGKDDDTIVNPRKLAWPLRESVCRQCHLEGEARLVKRGRGVFDFRPGMPFEDFWAVAVHSGGDDDIKVVNHVEQMEQSRCFQKSHDENKLGCISCHDPHVKPAEEQRVNYFRDRCLKCHAQKGCSVPEADRRRQQPQDSCMDCHMKQKATSDVPHVAGTDHRIPRRPAIDSPPKPGEMKTADGKLPVRLFHRNPQDNLSAEERRDFGVALADMLNAKKLAPDRPDRAQEYARKSLEFLDEALQSVPADAAAWEAKGAMQARLGRLSEARIACDEALKFEPNRETTVMAAASLAMAANQTDEAIELWKRVSELNPWIPHSYGHLTILYARRQQWREGSAASEAWVRLEPGLVEARRRRVAYLLRLDDRPAAAREFAVIEGLKPPNLAELQAWWKRETERPPMPSRPPGP